MKTETPKLTDAQKCGILAGGILFVIEGLRCGSINAKPIIKTDSDAEEYPIISLEQELWEVLGKVGITEKKVPEVPPKFPSSAIKRTCDRA